MTKKISTIAIPVLCLLLAGCGSDYPELDAYMAAQDAAKKAEDAKEAKLAASRKTSTQDEIREDYMGDSKSKIKEIFGSVTSILDGLWIIEFKTVDSSGGIYRTMNFAFNSDSKVNSISFGK